MSKSSVSRASGNFIGIVTNACVALFILSTIVFVAAATAMLCLKWESGDLQIEQATVQEIHRNPSNESRPHFGLILRSERIPSIAVDKISSSTEKTLTDYGVWKIDSTAECVRMNYGWELSYDVALSNIILPCVMLAVYSFIHLFSYLVLGFSGYKPVIFGREPCSFSMGASASSVPGWGPLNATWRGYIGFMGGAASLAAIIIVLGFFQRSLLHLTAFTLFLSIFTTIMQIIGGSLVVASLFSRKP